MSFIKTMQCTKEGYWKVEVMFQLSTIADFKWPAGHGSPGCNVKVTVKDGHAPGQCWGGRECVEEHNLQELETDTADV